MKRYILVVLLLITITACAAINSINQKESNDSTASSDGPVLAIPSGNVDYWQSVKPILDNRCVVCHACYDAPCQLKLTAIEGIERGASTDKIYDASRIMQSELTRLFEDGHSVQDWREKGFFPILDENANLSDANRDTSIIYQMLDLKENYPVPDSDLLPDEYTLGINRDNSCPKPETFHEFASEHPSWGMPYALPGLSNEEQSTLKQWLEQGAIYTPRKQISAELNNQVAIWETFLNQDALKAQLVNRYIYEHLFLAAIYFEETKEKTFFSLVRSATPPGQPVKLISTRRPYDDPGVDNVYYRLIPELESTVVKTHMPYVLNKARMQRWQSLFYEPKED